MDVRGLFVRVLQLVLSIVVLTIVAGILLVLLKANPANSIVSEVHSWARWLAGPFDGMFSFRSANDAIAVNWGIAAVVYLIVGGLIARLIGPTQRDRPLGRSSYPNQEIS
jgi:RsiW-degrading membrane proteinase PrsW (M82 family)